MNKLITIITIVAFTSVACVGAASAMPGNGGNDKPAPQQPGYTIKLNIYKGGAKGEATSPGDAFYPDTAAVGDPKDDCLSQGGKPVRISGEYGFYWSCEL